MSRTLSYVVEPQYSGLRLDAAMAQAGLYESRSQASKMIFEGRVFVQGVAQVKKYKVAVGDLIVYEIPEEAGHPQMYGQDIPLDIRYEDDHIIVLSKQAGLVCHPSVDHYDGTLVNALIHHCGRENLCNVQGEDDRLGIVHRLDRDTTGLMLAAKSNEAGSVLMQDIKDRVVDRHYLTLVQGRISLDSGLIDAPLARSCQDRLRIIVSDAPSARSAMTTFKVLERFEAGPKDEGFTLIDCKLFTGRTHQIRAHMNYIKHACVGDPVYGTGSEAMQLGLDRQFLHSYYLAFDHPITKEPMSFTDRPAKDLEQVLAALSPRSAGKTDLGYELMAQDIL